MTIGFPIYWPNDPCEFYRGDLAVQYLRSYQKSKYNMTFEEFKLRSINDAVKALQDDNRFRSYFIERIGVPGYILREWEEEVVQQVLLISPGKLNLA